MECVKKAQSLSVPLNYEKKGVAAQCTLSLNCVFIHDAQAVASPWEGTWVKCAEIWPLHRW